MLRNLTPTEEVIRCEVNTKSGVMMNSDGRSNLSRAPWDPRCFLCEFFYVFWNSVAAVANLQTHEASHYPGPLEISLLWSNRPSAETSASARQFSYYILTSFRKERTRKEMWNEITQSEMWKKLFLGQFLCAARRKFFKERLNVLMILVIQNYWINTWPLLVELLMCKDPSLGSFYWHFMCPNPKFVNFIN
jgi:hypothetical protein